MEHFAKIVNNLAQKGVVFFFLEFATFKKLEKESKQFMH